MRRHLPLTLAILAACSFGGGDHGGHGGHGKWGGKESKKRDPVTVVEVADVARGSVADTLSSSAVVESESMADLYPNTTGVVVSLHADEGDRVRKGDLLAVLDNVSLDVGAQRSNAEVRRLQEQYDELSALAARGAVSERELQDLEYQLQSAQLSAREARRSQGQTRITAPFDGVVAARDCRVGELATSGRAVFKVVDLDELRVVTSLPERDLPRVAVGQPARLTSAYNEDQSATGEVVRLAPIIDSASGTFRVTVDVDATTTLRPGQFVSVELEVDRHDDVVVVPKKALAYEDGLPVLYVQAEPTAEDLAKREKASTFGEGAAKKGKGGLFAFLSGDGDDKGAETEAPDEGTPWIARRTPVELGLVDDEHAEILSGVEPGLKVVTVGQNHLRDGARIRVVDTPADASAAATDAEASQEEQGGDAG